MKVALIGLGMVSRTYADAIANSDRVTLGPVYARNPESRAAFLAAYPALQAVEAESVHAIADDPEVGFVIVTTPPDARLEIAAILGQAGKPILMEKPIERTLEAATEVVELCEDLGVPLGIVLQHRARPDFQNLATQMDALGPLIAAEVSVPWWRPQSYYDEPGRGSYERDGGGVLITQAIHILDLMLALTGSVAEVSAMCATSAFHSMETEDFVVAGLAFSNGAVGQLFASTASFPGTRETIAVHCRDGSARLEGGVLRLDWQDGRSETIGEAAASGSGADPMAFSSDRHRNVIEDFAQAIETGRAPMITGRSALEVHRLIAVIEAASQAGARLSVREV
ncbi:MAG: Gfo/Idh/MocA family oxidoreductase [Silicimonas sp.]|nr:Gfo/Idh/MocA family oxidoreductase [Silicimonas sp.]